MCVIVDKNSLLLILYYIVFICIFYFLPFLSILSIFAVGLVFCNILSFGCWEKQISPFAGH